MAEPEVSTPVESFPCPGLPYTGLLFQQFKQAFLNPRAFPCVGGVTLRSYQVAVAEKIVDSVLRHLGLSFVVLFPRQSGKNELQAQIEAYLLKLLGSTDAEIIKISPTWKPQSLNAMRRLQRILERNVLTRDSWIKEQGYIYRIDRARIFFLSGGPEANIVGATASTLLEVDEAQDVLTAKFDKDIAPMAASTNATRVFWGTAWTSKTLLAREMRAALEAERQDGMKRVFRIDADVVAAEVPAYGKFVAEQVARLGRNHPMVKTQFFSEEIDAEGGMFPPARRSLMMGQHKRQHAPTPGHIYALLLDVAGEDETAGDAESGGELTNARRDSPMSSYCLLFRSFYMFQVGLERSDFFFIQRDFPRRTFTHLLGLKAAPINPCINCTFKHAYSFCGSFHRISAILPPIWGKSLVYDRRQSHLLPEDPKQLAGK